MRSDLCTTRFIPTGSIEVTAGTFMGRRLTPRDPARSLVMHNHDIKKGGRHSRLIIEKVNSDSPNHFTPNMLIAHAQMQIAAVYAA